MICMSVKATAHISTVHHIQASKKNKKKENQTQTVPLGKCINYLIAFWGDREELRELISRK